MRTSIYHNEVRFFVDGVDLGVDLGSFSMTLTHSPPPEPIPYAESIRFQFECRMEVRPPPRPRRLLHLDYRGIWAAHYAMLLAAQFTTGSARRVRALRRQMRRVTRELRKAERGGMRVSPPPVSQVTRGGAA